MILGKLMLVNAQRVYEILVNISKPRSLLHAFYFAKFNVVDIFGA